MTHLTPSSRPRVYLSVNYGFFNTNVIIEFVFSSATAQGYTFMTVEDITTLPGYPQHYTLNGETLHVQTRLMFYYKTDCELCQVVNANSRRRRRRRRQTDDTRRILSNDFVHHVLTDQA